MKIFRSPQTKPRNRLYMQSPFRPILSRFPNTLRQGLHMQNREPSANFNEIQGRFGTILADPPWRFANRTGKMAPEHRRLTRYHTMRIEEICALPVAGLAAEKSHLYLWCPNALLPWGLQVIQAWGFQYKANLVWYKIRKDGGPDG